MHEGVSHEGVLAVLLFGYLLIRYVAVEIFKRFTVHRGMYHSIPAMLIAGLCVYLAYHSDNRNLRILLGCGVMLGFYRTWFWTKSIRWAGTESNRS